MKRILISIALLACLISGYAHAVTYTFTGANFTNVFGAYTTAMRITGTLITSTPIPPNYSGDLSGLLTSWSFNDGLQTINSANGVFHPNRSFSVGTDGSGNINSFEIFATRLPLGTAIGDLDNIIYLEFLGLHADIDTACFSVSEGYCNNWSSSVAYAGAPVENAVWVTSDLPSTPIPTMNQWSLMLLALLLGMVGITRIRRQV